VNLKDSKLKQVLRQVKIDLLDGYAIKSYSLEGEDMILKSLFEERQTGFYIDVGAHHPKKFSNTYFFYKRGWSGINIDAMPGSMEPFRKIRSRDINLEAAIAKEPREMTFFIFDEPALNTFDSDLAAQRIREKFQVIAEKKITTKTLKEILNECLPKGTKITFLSIDVEGLDLEVLQSNDWQAFRPECVLVECLGLNMNDLQNNPVYQFLAQQQYEVVAKTGRTVFFQDSTL